ncbi:hypothetical protein P6B95_19950 [Streptomyces atratus]|uniref:hypothetical protein n=1 Tax=Streptomyces atratus TaxID=1893 RepID=UPI002AC31E69|nr:hypothetical protein [Streptomyces atratus]WPW29428.1 hypothetical protein P6B95_19950 [Streptomyces atratus]
MQIHRSRHTRGFTVLPNALLQDRRLSYTARGLLADLLSRPDGWSEDGRRMADASPQGRLAVAKALRELTAFGYYRVHKVRRSDGTFVSEAHVYDTPQPVSGTALVRQVVPGISRPGSGEPIVGGRGANPVKNRGKRPSLPGRRQRPSAADACEAAEVRGGGAATGTGDPVETSLMPKTLTVPEVPAARDVLTVNEVFGAGPGRGHVDPSTADARGAAVATLFRVIRPEPRLRLGTVEALALAPLVSAWLERGYDHRDLAGALLGGLPARIHSASAILRNRLVRKLPPPPEPSIPECSTPEPPGPAMPRWAECDECGRPIPHEGTCRDCARPVDGPRPDDDSALRVRTAARGRALVRAVLRTDHSELPAVSGA